MKIGIVGLTTVGKTTLFNLLTGSSIATQTFSSGKKDANIGTAAVPDERIDYLSEMFKPKKTTYAQIQFIDVAGLERGSGASSNKFLEALRQVDAVAHVVRVFQNPQVMHPEGSINPIRDVDILASELLFSDLGVIEKRLEKLNSSKKSQKEKREEIELLERCKVCLEEERPISSLDISNGEREILRSYGFLTEKPLMLVINLDEEQFYRKDYPGRKELHEYAAKNGIPIVELCALMEMEINELTEEDRRAFMKELGIKEPGISVVAKKAYEYLGLIPFFTAGEDEVKAWTIKKGTTAKDAAGKIHSDIQRGFIRAEVIAFNDLKESGSIAAARSKGLLRLEGKDYVVQDGDIINFRFNV